MFVSDRKEKKTIYHWPVLHKKWDYIWRVHKDDSPFHSREVTRSSHFLSVYLGQEVKVNLSNGVSDSNQIHRGSNPYLLQKKEKKRKCIAYWKWCGESGEAPYLSVVRQPLDEKTSELV